MPKMCFIVPILLVVMGLRSHWEGRAVSFRDNDRPGAFFRISGAAEVILGLAVLGLLIARGCSSSGGFNIMMGAGLSVSAILFILFRRSRRGDADTRDMRRELSAELVLLAGGMTLVVSGLAS